jgi:hypothetical protein
VSIATVYVTLQYYLVLFDDMTVSFGMSLEPQHGFVDMSSAAIKALTPPNWTHGQKTWVDLDEFFERLFQARLDHDLQDLIHMQTFIHLYMQLLEPSPPAELLLPRPSEDFVPLQELLHYAAPLELKLPLFAHDAGRAPRPGAVPMEAAGDVLCPETSSSGPAGLVLALHGAGAHASHPRAVTSEERTARLAEVDATHALELLARDGGCQPCLSLVLRESTPAAARALDRPSKQMVLDSVAAMASALLTTVDVVYFAGAAQPTTGAWCLNDTEQLSPQELVAHWVEKMAEPPQHRHQLLVIADSSFSGLWTAIVRQYATLPIAVVTATDAFERAPGWTLVPFLRDYLCTTQRNDALLWGSHAQFLRTPSYDGLFHDLCAGVDDRPHGWTVSSSELNHALREYFLQELRESVGACVHACLTFCVFSSLRSRIACCPSGRTSAQDTAWRRRMQWTGNKTSSTWSATAACCSFA